MTSPVVVGVDGSRQSMDAAAWAGREAAMRSCPLRIVFAVGGGEGVVGFAPTEAEESVLAARDRAVKGHSPRDVSAEVLSEAPVPALVTEAEEASVLVLGSRGLGGFTGFVLGSVGLSTIAHATCPVVAVRAQGTNPGESGADSPAPSGPVVVGVDLRHFYGPVLAFACAAAALRATSVRVVHAWSVQHLYAYPSALPDPRVVAEADATAARDLQEAVRPWRNRYPHVPFEEQSGAGGAAPFLLTTSSDASLLVVGRRLRGHPFPTRIGPVTHAALHHAPCPVAVVPHD